MGINMDESHDFYFVYSPENVNFAKVQNLRKVY